MKKTALRSGAGLAFLVLMTTSVAQVSDLMLSKSANNVDLAWTTGTSPYRVIRSLDPRFISGNASVAGNLALGNATDPAALLATESYFYQVLGDNEPNPPLYDANEPRLVPSITMLTPGTGQAGTSVTIDGMNFAEFGGGQTVLFGSLPAEVQSSTETQIIATAPSGTVTDDVVVCVVDNCSNGVRFTVTVGPTFQDLSSFAFEPGTGSLWVGDRGTADDVIEIDSTGTVSIRASLGEAFISNPSPGDGTGRIYYSNGTVSNFNQGTVSYIDSSDNTTTFFRAAGQGGGVDPVHARGMAARDDEPDVVYFLDGNNNTVRRVPEFGLIDFNWGNTALSFNNPAGGRFDAAGNLYVSSTTAIHKIAPDEAVTVVASGFTAAAGIDLAEDTGIVTLLVVDQAAGRVHLVNTETGVVDLIDEGFTSPIATAFTTDPATGDVFYDLAEPTRILRLPDPKIVFTKPVPTDPDAKKPKETARRVLTHKYSTDDMYPSSSQTMPGEIDVEVTVIGVASGESVYFRLVDPPAQVGYRAQSGAQAGDNKGGIGTLTGCTGDPATRCVAPLGADGKINLVLGITDTFAGDNYQIEASTKDPNVGGFKKESKSAIYTAWKRAYIEYDRMYKEGAFIDQTSSAGQTQVFVTTPATFTAGDMVHIFSAESPATKTGDMRTVVNVPVGGDHIVVDGNLSQTYTYTAGVPPVAPGDAPPYSYVAKVTPGVYGDVKPPVRDLVAAFDDAFTEWVVIETDGVVPGWTTVPNDLTGRPAVGRSAAFFENREFSAPSNTVQLVAAGFAVGPLVAGGTVGDGTTNVSWVFVDRITSNLCMGCSGAQLGNYINTVAAHELAHQWNVNKPQDPGGHDSENAWNNATRKCLMNSSRDRTLGRDHFHADLTATSIDLYCIRGHVDNLNLDTCTWPPEFP